MESCGYSVLCGPVGSVGELVRVKHGRFEVLPDQFLKALLNDRCKSYWSVITQAAGVVLLQESDNCLFRVFYFQYFSRCT